ncbi:hydrogenase nickel incorporation protein HypB [Xanthobacter autotrophicus]|uniref:hydrogenase nickel incorporation protein HypB n=1 Tax=Xanthobacter autotrophicus TaxID=280 RepID=UPI0024A76C7D|nr:hydrogenase nickel incorporation protein HypB [Xanthobacter autotrophicus]MDI4657402.1 hydrogenase nickel incorporation protein HypB [Xanthobacter autotrophicus]
MCTVCGCSGDGATLSDATGGHEHAHGEGHSHAPPHAHGEAHVHTHADGTTHSHGHGHEHGHHHAHAHAHHDDHDHHPAGGTLDYGAGPARAHAPGLSQARMVEIETSILAKNDDYATRNRARFEAAGLLALNLLSGPGAGKTTLLVETLKALAGRLPTAVIEGDQQTDNDAARIRAAGAPAVQINTGKGCHLDAHMVGHAVEKLPLPPGGVLFIENVGNLVCPAAFDLGETKRVTLISVAEGDDKPLKYPDIFEGADLVLITKADLAPYVDADMAQLEANIRRVNPRAEILRVSARGEVGLSRWLAWLDKARSERLDALAAARESEAQALRAAMVAGGAR